MMKRVCRGSFLALLFACSVAVAKEQPPVIQSDRDLGFFAGTRAETLALVKRVGLLPVLLPPGFDAHEDARQLIQKSVTENLRKAGMDVVGPDAYQASYDRLNRQLGGIYSAETGEVKPEQYQAVLDNAQREFVEGERLDGLVMVRVLTRSAKFRMENAFWDGATDSSMGRRPANALVALFSSTGAEGTLPAYSLILQIANTQDKIVFGRRGGIQLGAYYDPARSEGTTGFVDVEKEDLFLDPARIERAVRIATLPLLHSAEEIAAGEKDPVFNPGLITGKDLPPAPEGVSRVARSPLHVPRAQILQGVHRVALTSLDAGPFAPPDAVRARLVELVQAELAPLGWEILAAPGAHEQLAAGTKSAGGLFDPLTGALIEERARSIRKSVISGLGFAPPPDAILWIGLKRAIAMHRLGDAEWDGVSQSAVTLGPVKKKLFGGSADVLAGEGTVQAVSLSVQLRDANDKLLYDSSGGIQLVQQLRGKKLSTLAPDELFRDAAREQPAVHAALRELVLTPEQLDAERHPRTTPR